MLHQSCGQLSAASKSTTNLFFSLSSANFEPAVIVQPHIQLYPLSPPLPLPSTRSRCGVSMKIEGKLQLASKPKKGGILRRENVLTSIGSCTKLCYTHISFYVVCVQVWVCGGKLIRNPRKTPAEWELYCSSAARHQCTYICTIFLCSMYFICMYSIRIRGWHQGQIHRAKGSSELLDLL